MPEKGLSGKPVTAKGRRALLERHRWLTFVLPLLVFMLVGAVEPDSPDAGRPRGWPAIPYGYYPVTYTLKIALTAAAILFVLPGYRQFPLRVSPLAVLVGVAGIFLWVGICAMRLEEKLLGPLGLDWLIGLGTRSAFNPLQQLGDCPAVWRWGFLVIRLFGLVVVIALAEELFLRGFLMRLAVDARWWEVPFGKVSRWAVVIGTAAPMLMHPAEMFAAAAWFSLVTWLMVKTKNIWDCVAAHAVTNLLLGVYVVFSGQWHLM